MVYPLHRPELSAPGGPASAVAALDTATFGRRPMSKPNGRQQKAIEGLAAALNECFAANIEVAERRIEQRLEKFDQRLDRQDATLRMIWTQCGGKADQHLPIDD